MQLVTLFENENIADIVRADYRTARVFQECGINYCCEGNQSLQDACSRMNLAYVDVVGKLNQVTQTVNLPLDLQFDKWKIDFLIDYIVNIHHAYLRQALPQLETDLQQFRAEHPDKYPQVETVMAIRSAICVIVEREQVQQETALFPYIKQMYSAHLRRESYGKLFVKTMGKPINLPTGDTDQLKQYLATLRKITGNYHSSDKECTGYNVLVKRLRELDNQLVLHKHLENNILFPSAVSMEQELLAT